MLDRNDPARTVFLIPEAHMPRLEREVAKLSKKAEKWHGWAFDVLVFGFQFRDERDGTKTKLIEVSLDVETIKLDGWEFLARLDHAQDTGNIVRSVPNAVVDVAERFRHSAPDCEHCNHRRLRRDTFVLYDAESGEYKQVGSTCLADFLGHEATKLGRIAELAGYATELARALEKEPVSNDPRVLQERRYIDLADYLVHCATMIRVNGWVSGKAAYENKSLTATRWVALDNMLTASMTFVVEPTDEDQALAEKARAWVQGFADLPSLDEYQHNVLTLANAVVIDTRACGLAASIVGVYWLKHTPKRGKAQLGDLTEVLTLFGRAARLRNPKINLDFPDTGKIVLSVAGPRSKAPGTINVATPGGYEANTWYGRVNLDGSFTPTRQAPAALEARLALFAADPAKVAGEHGHRTGQCCFCNRPLTDERSTEVGYGPVCADTFALPWG
jgi:hypothetical protein